MAVLIISMQRHGKWQNQGLGDYIAIAMASFTLLSLTMWPLLALMNGFSFPQQATGTQRMVAASISCVLWFVGLYWRPQMILWRKIRKA